MLTCCFVGKSTKQAGRGVCGSEGKRERESGTTGGRVGGQGLEPTGDRGEVDWAAAAAQSMAEMEIRVGPGGTGDDDGWIRSYGTLDCGAETMRAAWPRLRHVFSGRGNRAWHEAAEGPSPEVVLSGTRPARGALHQHPVDLLVVERGHIRRPHRDPTVESWEKLVAHTEQSVWPKVVVESWRGQAISWSNGPTDKAARTRWQALGYETRTVRVSGTEVGGAIEQERLLVARVEKASYARWSWDQVQRGGVVRPMANLLTPDGLLPRRRERPPTEAHVSEADSDPMPARSGAWIRTDKRTRRVTKEELARGLGVPKEWELSPDGLDMDRTTSVFHWEFLGASFRREAAGEYWPTVRLGVPVSGPSDSPTGEEQQVFDWRPPDLSPGGRWHQERVRNLHRATSGHPDCERLRSEGMRMLETHRGNYDEHGPALKSLQLLWWEFPPEHWDDLREGSRMNFLRAPADGLHPNSEMDEEQRRVATQFVDELVEINAVGVPPADRPIRTTTPLFCVPKPGQPGEWRVIADMKAGGQNDAVGADPVYLPRVSHILDEMYAGGYTAIVDASKFFYQFGTHPDDRPWLGVRHPGDDRLLEWVGLPMGAGNSPAMAGRYGAAFLRLLRERKGEIFGERGRANCWWTGFEADGTFDPKLGYGYILTRKDGRPGVKVWIFVDDVAIHGPDYESTAEALRFFFDLAVDVGLLCHPGKCYPPSQRAKYCGFVLDSTGIPELQVPTDKRERASAMLDDVLAKSPEWRFSRLSLAVLGGTLESLAEATPRRLGHTRLRRFHSVAHPAGYGEGAAVYYTCTELPEDVRNDLRWWRLFLSTGGGRCARTERSGTLVPTWGDGSGTGTRGDLGSAG